MAKRGRHPHSRKRQGRQDPHMRRTRPAAGHRHGAGDLVTDVRQQLASGEPLGFLAYVSTLLAAVDPRGESPFERGRGDGTERVGLPTLLESFAEVVLPETWPASRPLTEWLLRLMPEGGTGFVRPRWGKTRRKKLADRFFGSVFGTPLDDAGHRDLLEQFLWFGTDYGPGDPLRWSPVAVEILLADWIPRKIVADASYLSKAPELLRAFIRFCHAEGKIRPELTGQTLAAVDEHELEYQRVICSPRPQGPMALLAQLGVLGDEEPPDDEPFDFHRHFLDQLAEEVGGQDALDSLDCTPLPHEELAWDQ